MDRNLQWLTAGVAVRMLGNALYTPFLALFLQNGLHIGYVEIGIIVVGVGVIQLPFNFAGGLLTDRVGRRRVIVLGLGGEAAATAVLAYGFAETSLWIAIAAALIGGTVATAAGPAYSAYISDFASGSERTRGFTWFRIGFNAGYSAGVTLGGVLASVVGFAWAVAVGAIVIGVSTLLLAASLGPSPFDRTLAAASAHRNAPLRATDPPAPSRGLRESIAILAKDRGALEVLVAVALSALVIGQWAITFPLYVHNVLAIPYSLLGAGLALNGLVVVFGQRNTTESVIGWKHTTIAIVGTLFYLVAFLGLGVSGLLAFFPVAVFFAAVVVLTIGENLVTIPSSTLPSNLAPPSEIGSYNGAFGMIGGAGFLASVLLGTFVLSLGLDPLLTWVVLVVPAVPAIALFRDSARRIPPAANRA